VKEKFGGLRIQMNYANDAIRQRIEAAEEESFHTCEVCRQSGTLRESGSRLCDEHARTRRSEKIGAKFRGDACS